MTKDYSKLDDRDITSVSNPEELEATEDELQYIIDVENGTRIDASTIFFPAENSKATIIMSHGGAGTICTTDPKTSYGHLMPSSAVRFLKERNISTILIHTAPAPLPFAIGAICARLPWVATNNMQDAIKMSITSKVFFERLESINKETQSVLSTKEVVRQLKDYCKLVDNAMKLNNEPIYLLGLCNSNYLMSYYYNQLANRERIAGMIFSSIYSLEILQTIPAHVLERYHTSLNFFPKDEVLDIPMLLIHHAKDISDGTNPENAVKLKNQLKSNKTIDIKILEGGINRGHPKLGYGHHGFRGIEPEYATVVADFIDRQA